MTDTQRANIRQQHSPADYPFYDFNPLFRTHPGVGYWKGGADLAVKQRQIEVGLDPVARTGWDAIFKSK